MIDPCDGCLVPSDGSGVTKEDIGIPHIAYEVIQGGSSKVRNKVGKILYCYIFLFLQSEDRGVRPILN